MRIISFTCARVLAVALPTVLLSFTALAQADIGEKIILRCTHNESLAGFTQKDYNRALQELETSLEEYGDCAMLIHQAQLAAAGSRGGSSGSGGGGGGSATGGGATTAATPATPAEQRALSRAPSAGAAPLLLGDQVIRPGVVHADIASAFSSLPTPLLAVLLFLFACAVALAGGVLQNRVRGRHGD
jgi:hypothetical protein